MLVQIELVAPVAVCYQPTTPARTTPRAIFCDLQKNDPREQEKLSDFFLGHTNETPCRPFVFLKSDDDERWQQDERYSELMLGPHRFSDDLVYCQFTLEHLLLDAAEVKRYLEENLSAPWVDFLFSPTATDNDVWRVSLSDVEPVILSISSGSRSSFGGSVINPNLPDGGLIAQQHGWLQPTLDEPYLPCYATDTEALKRWQNQPLPFRVRQSE